MSDDLAGRHVDSLLRSYGEVSKLQAEQGVEIRTLGERAAEDRRDMEQMETRLLAAIGRSEQRQRDLVKSVKESCDAGWESWEKWIAKYERDRKAEKEAEKADRQADRQYGLARWMLVLGVISAIVAAITCVVGLAAFLTGVIG
jgi:hypothetical protein